MIIFSNPGKCLSVHQLIKILAQINVKACLKHTQSQKKQSVCTVDNELMDVLGNTFY